MIVIEIFMKYKYDTYILSYYVDKKGCVINVIRFDFHSA